MVPAWCGRNLLQLQGCQSVKPAMKPASPCLKELPTHLKAFICEGPTGFSVSHGPITVAEGFSALAKINTLGQNHFKSEFLFVIKMKRYGCFAQSEKYECSSLNLHICLTLLSNLLELKRVGDVAGLTAL